MPLMEVTEEEERQIANQRLIKYREMAFNAGLDAGIEELSAATKTYKFSEGLVSSIIAAINLHRKPTGELK